MSWPVYLVIRSHNDDPPTHLSDQAVRKYLTAYWSHTRLASRTAIWDAMRDLTRKSYAMLATDMGEEQARDFVNPRKFSWAVYRLYGSLGPTGVEGELSGLLVYVRQKGARYGRWLAKNERPDIPKKEVA